MQKVIKKGPELHYDPFSLRYLLILVFIICLFGQLSAASGVEAATSDLTDSATISINLSGQLKSAMLVEDTFQGLETIIEETRKGLNLKKMDIGSKVVSISSQPEGYSYYGHLSYNMKTLSDAVKLTSRMKGKGYEKTYYQPIKLRANAKNNFIGSESLTVTIYLSGESETALQVEAKFNNLKSIVIDLGEEVGLKEVEVKEKSVKTYSRPGKNNFSGSVSYSVAPYEAAVTLIDKLNNQGYQVKLDLMQYYSVSWWGCQKSYSSYDFKHRVSVLIKAHLGGKSKSRLEAEKKIDDLENRVKKLGEKKGLREIKFAGSSFNVSPLQKENFGFSGHMYFQLPHYHDAITLADLLNKQGVQTDLTFTTSVSRGMFRCL